MSDLIKSICVIPADGYDELWISVERDNGIFIERMSEYPIYEDVYGDLYIYKKNQIFCDSSVTTLNSSSINGLDHLEGLEVSILADGVVLNPQTVSSGAVSLGATYSIAHAGLSYYSDLETLNIDLGLNDGTAQGKHIKISNVFFRIEKTSAHGLLGPNENILYEGFSTDNLANGSNFEDAIGTGDDRLFTCDVRVPLGAGYKRGGNLFFRQSDPVPTNINAIIPEVTVPSSGVK